MATNLVNEGIFLYKDEQKHYLKLRIFPTQKAREELSFPLEPTEKLTDHFYDTEDFSNGENNRHIKKRGDKYILQECEMVGDILSYSETFLPSLPPDCDQQPFLSYSFLRYRGKSFNKVISYLDILKVNQKEDYEVVTISKEIDPELIGAVKNALQIGNLILALFTVDLNLFVDLKAILKKFINITESKELEQLYSKISGSSEYLPLPTKFMTMMQLSVNAHLYLDIFSRHDAFLYSHTDHLREMDKSIATKYFWTSSNRMGLFLAQFNAVFERSNDPLVAYQKATSYVEELYERNNQGDFSFAIFGELF